jgi:hypothetical protein
MDLRPQSRSHAAFRCSCVSCGSCSHRVQERVAHACIHVRMPKAPVTAMAHGQSTASSSRDATEHTPIYFSCDATEHTWTSEVASGPSIQTRIAGDGLPYTYEEFKKHDGSTTAQWKWNQCATHVPNTRGAATEHTVPVSHVSRIAQAMDQIATMQSTAARCTSQRKTKMVKMMNMTTFFFASMI